MPTQLIAHTKRPLSNNSFIEYKIWRLDKPKLGSSHLYAYRMVYVVDGVRVVGFDNERGKGDHCHIDGKEEPYYFVSVKTLVADFLAAVRKQL